jgi:alkanesulfonate monooxygenase SsuD/methylene tetrahydromethanopterin reductase-like flavin-dependent oxidoreductase (luciferase family)
VSEVSGGRLDLGLGAGWHEGEHRMFGFAFPSLRERMDRLECGARVVRALWRGGPVTLEQPYYPLVEAQTTPRPAPGTRLIVGGRGERRTLRVVAEHADEWNVTRLTPADYPAKAAVLEAHCRAVGRDPKSIGRSLMVPIAVGRTPAEARARAEKAYAIMPRLPQGEAAWREAGFLHGTPGDVVPTLRRWEALGVGRVMLQLLDQDDLAAIDLIAREVLPAFRPAG